MDGDTCLDEVTLEGADDAPTGPSVPDEICPYGDVFIESLPALTTMSLEAKEKFFARLGAKEAYMRRSFYCTGHAPEVCDGCKTYPICYKGKGEDDIPHIDLCGIREWLEAAGVKE